MKNIKLRATLLFPLLAGALIGCTTNKSSGEQSSKQDSNSTQPAKSVEIRFWHTFGQTIVDGLKTKIESYQKLVKEHDNVDVTVTLTYQGSYDDIATKISNGFSVGNKPTIAVAYPDNVANYLEIAKSANEEFVVDLDKYIDDKSVGFGKESWLGDKEDADDFVEGFYSEGSKYNVSGTYSLPFMKSTEIMFYNLDLVTYAMKGYRPDFHDSAEMIKEYMSTLTWDEFINFCTYIKTNMNDISDNLEVPFVYDSDANFFISKLYQENIPYASIGNDGKGSIDFAKEGNREKTIKFLEDAHDLYANGLLTTKGVRGTYGSDFFTGEKCVFSIGSSGGSGYNFPQGGAFELEVCRVPASNNNPLYVSQGPTLALFHDDNVDPDVELYAWKFMKYITSTEVNASLCADNSEGYIPVRYSSYETSKFLSYLEEGENYAKCAKVVVNEIKGKYLVSPAFKGSAELRDECGSLLTASLTKSKDQIPTLLQTAVDNAIMKL